MQSLRYKVKRLNKMYRIMKKGGIVGETGINPQANWVDDWFAAENIDENTVVISEPRYFLRNNSYVIMGEKRAVLFDTGSGKRDIKPLIRKITSLPLTVVTSHVHSDHLGNIGRFENYALADLPINRSHTYNNVFKPSLIMYADLSRPPKIPVSSWLSIEEPLDLGNRLLEIVHIPGHSADSIALFDKENRMIFMGDFLYEGNLVCLLGGSVYDYIESTRRLIELTAGQEIILPGHYTYPLSRELLFELEAGLAHIINGEVSGRRYTFSRKYRISNKLAFITSQHMINTARLKMGKANAYEN